MSYILDALKKADQERQQGEIPDLRSGSPITTQPASAPRSMLWLLLLVMAIIALVWFKPWQDQLPPPSNNMQSNNPQPEPVQPALTEQAPPQTVQTGSAQSENRHVEVVKAASPSPTVEAAPQVTTSGTGNIPNIMGLPANIRSSLPAIHISGHIYDATPASRMVIINDSVRREGRYISDNLMLDEITENGIVLNYSGTLFFMSVFDSWPR